ncbi:MAG: c-type cytochrome [Phycisphaerales bacterium]
MDITISRKDVQGPASEAGSERWSSSSGSGALVRAPARKPINPDPNKWPSIGLAALFALMLPSVMVAMFLMMPPRPVSQMAVAAEELGVDPEVIRMGHVVYQSSCMICHASDGSGMPGLGKPLRNSAFVQESTDEELFRLVVEGRMPTDPANTTGALMPARGAKGLSDEQMRAVVHYMRMMQEPDAPVASLDAWTRAPAAVLAVGETDPFESLRSHPGHDMYQASCMACHGERGEGMESLGLPLVNSGFVIGASDKELATFIKTGRPIWDANNQTGMDMPPRGGNPTLDDDGIELIISYVRAMQDASGGTAYEPSSAGPDAGAPASDRVGFADDPGLEAARLAYLASCAACHGQRGEGMESLGLPLASSAFVGGKSDAEMMAFIKTGRSPWDPENQTGMDMPAKGGNPALKDSEIELIIAYIRAMQSETNRE